MEITPKVRNSKQNYYIKCKYEFQAEELTDLLEEIGKVVKSEKCKCIFEMMKDYKGVVTCTVGTSKLPDEELNRYLLVSFNTNLAFVKNLPQDLSGYRLKTDDSDKIRTADQIEKMENDKIDDNEFVKTCFEGLTNAIDNQSQHIFPHRGIGPMQDSLSEKMAKAFENYRETDQNADLMNRMLDKMKKDKTGKFREKYKEVLEKMWPNCPFEVKSEEQPSCKLVLKDNEAKAGSGDVDLLKSPEGVYESILFSLIMAKALVKGGSTTLCYDEPNRSMHRSLCERMRTVISDLTAENRICILMSTHSPSFVSPLTWQHIYCFQRSLKAPTLDSTSKEKQLETTSDPAKDQNPSTSEPIIDPGPFLSAKALDFEGRTIRKIKCLSMRNLREILFATRILFVEGESDLYFVEELTNQLQKRQPEVEINIKGDLKMKLEKNKRALGSITVIVMEGKGNADNVADLCKHIGLKHAFLMDRDAGSKQEQDGHKCYIEISNSRINFNKEQKFQIEFISSDLKYNKNDEQKEVTEVIAKQNDEQKEVTGVIDEQNDQQKVPNYTMNRDASCKSGQEEQKSQIEFTSSDVTCCKKGKQKGLNYAKLVDRDAGFKRGLEGQKVQTEFTCSDIKLIKKNVDERKDIFYQLSSQISSFLNQLFLPSGKNIYLTEGGPKGNLEKEIERYRIYPKRDMITENVSKRQVEALTKMTEMNLENIDDEAIKNLRIVRNMFRKAYDKDPSKDSLKNIEANCYLWKSGNIEDAINNRDHIEIDDEKPFVEIDDTRERKQEEIEGVQKTPERKQEEIKGVQKITPERKQEEIGVQEITPERKQEEIEGVKKIWYLTKKPSTILNFTTEQMKNLVEVILRNPSPDMEGFVKFLLAFSTS